MLQSTHTLARHLIVLALFSLWLSACAIQPDRTQVAVAPVEASNTAPPIPQYTVLGDANFPALTLADAALSNRLLSEAPRPKPIPHPPRNLWDSVRAGFALPDHHNPGVRNDLKWYSAHTAYLERVTDRATPYLYYIVHSLQKRHMPTEIALLPIVESAYYPFAYSHGRASGIWQFIPGTGRLYGLKQDWWYDGRRDVYASTKAALTYLQNLHKQFNGDWLLALAAYNSGAGTVQYAIRRNERRGKPIDFWSLDLPPETRDYVPKLLALADIMANPKKYGVSVDPIPNQPYFKRVDVGSQMDLALAARLADMKLDNLYMLNAGYNRWATAPNGPHYLLLPIDKVKQFKRKLAELPPNRRITWLRHRITKGETLGTIAQKYRITVATLRRVNRLRGQLIRAGSHLLIPVASRKPSAYALSEDQRRRTAQRIPHGGRKLVHIVTAGDTFWGLARAHHVSVQQLAKWNAMAPRDLLQPGQRLVIWSHARRVSISRRRTIQAPPHRQRVTQRVGYTVRSGDSLARISQRFKVSVKQLRYWNRLPKGKYIQPGQYLTVYVDVTHQSGNI